MELWQIAKPFGRPAKFANAEALWQAFVAYLEWSANNPMTVNDTKSQRVGSKRSSIEKKLEKEGDSREEKRQYKQTVERPLSLIAFRLHANIKREWATFKADYSAKSEDFRQVLQAIEATIRSQQVSNALVGNYKENLVARLNGISDTIKQEHSGEITTRKSMSISEAKQIIHEVESKI